MSFAQLAPFVAPWACGFSFARFYCLGCIFGGLECDFVCCLLPCFLFCLVTHELCPPFFFLMTRTPVKSDKELKPWHLDVCLEIVEYGDASILFEPLTRSPKVGSRKSENRDMASKAGSTRIGHASIPIHQLFQYPYRLYCRSFSTKKQTQLRNHHVYVTNCIQRSTTDPRPSSLKRVSTKP